MLLSGQPTAPMREALERVIVRIDKELARPISANHGTTAYVGGIAKLGALIEQYLRAVYLWSCERSRLDASVFARSISATIVVDRAGAGQLLLLLHAMSRYSVAHEPPVQWVFAEAREGSALHQFIELRNAIVHGRSTFDAATVQSTLAKLRRALHPQLVLLEKPA
jgi:hypothetical protein